MLDFFKKNHFLLAGVLFFLISIFLTFPVFFKFGTAIPMWDSDTYQVIARVEAQLQIFEEQGTWNGLKSSGAHSVNIIALYAALASFIGLIPAYNFLFFASFVLSGIGAYMLAYYFTKNKTASFLAGFIFAFSPFHFHQSLSTNVGSMHQEVLPFFVLAFFKFLENLKFRYYVLLVFSALIVALVEHQLLAFSVLFSLVLLGYKLYSERKLFWEKKIWIYAGLSSLFLVVLLLFFFRPLFEVAVSENNFLDPGINQAKRYSMNLLDPLAPPLTNTFFSGVNEIFQKIFLFGGTRETGLYFLGFTTMLIITYYFYGIRKKRIKKLENIDEQRNLRFWIIAAIAFSVFALGPLVTIGKMDIPLPYYIIHQYFPFYENIRTTGRYFVYVVLAISMITAFSVKGILKNFDFGKKVKILAVATLLLSLEFSSWPINTIAPEYSPFYDKLALEKETFRILEIPGSTSYSFASYQMITSNVHGKEIANGMPLARVIKGQFTFQKITPVFKQLLYIVPNGKMIDNENTADIINGNFYEYATGILNYHNIRYVTLNKEFIKNENAIVSLSDFLQKNVAIQSVYEDEYIIAYEIKKEPIEGYYATVDHESRQWGNSREQGKTGKAYRPAFSGARMAVFLLEKESGEFNISMDMQSYEPMKVVLMRNEEVIKEAYSEGEWDAGEWKTISFDIKAYSGENNIFLYIYDSEGNEITDTSDRKKGVQFSNINITLLK